MNVNDMHIEFNQSLQQVASHRTRKYNSGEIDWILTKMQERLIQSSISPKKDGSGGFEVNALYASRISSLIVSDITLPAYIDPGKDNRYRVVFPYDYAYLLDDRSKTIVLCGGVTPQTGSQSLTMYALRQNYSPKTVPDFYSSMQVNLGTTVNIPTDLSFGNTYNGYNRKSDVQDLVPIVSKLGKYYWEKYGDLYYKPGHYIIVNPLDQVVTPSMVIDGEATTTSEASSFTVQMHIGQGKISKNRLTPTNKISSLLDTAFYKTSHYSPVSELGDKVLFVYYDNSFIVTEVVISYVRKCAPISLSLGSNSELPEEFHQQICDLAVEYTQGRLKDIPGYQLTENDNNNRVML